MKTTRLYTAVKFIFSGVLAALVLFLFDSCTPKMSFLTSQVVPAARGSVKVKKDKNHNYTIQVHVENLAEVKRLDPPKQTYVVWMMTDQETAKNLGQLNSSSSLLSKNLKASFETVSVTKPVKIFITAEEDGNTQFPGLQILSTNNF